MPDVRYVCLSDLHFGEEDSLLTSLKAGSTDADATVASPVLRRLVACLRSLVRQNVSRDKPTLILLGDIFELALAHEHQAAMTFERFIELVLPPDEDEWLFDEIIYVPGNHDHHIWESARETWYVETISAIEPPARLPVVAHTTRLFAKDAGQLIPAYFPTRLVRRYPHLRVRHPGGHIEDRVPIRAAYPNYGLCSDDGARCVLFHHGHYVEPLYHLMSTMKTLFFPKTTIPTNVEELEGENFAWVDFFWSAMGSSGEVGRDIEVIYERLLDTAATRRMIDDLARELARRYDLPGWGDRMEAAIARLALRFALNRAAPPERFQTAEPLSDEAREGLQSYMTGPLRAQLLDELNRNMPADVTFVFGHTHKPFEADLDFEGYPRWVNVYNTGGWVVDTTKADAQHGGAVVLVDEALNVTSLRMYNESADPRGYVVRVSEARHAGEPEGVFHRRVKELVAQEPAPWEAFSAAVADAVSERQRNLEERLEHLR